MPERPRADVVRTLVRTQMWVHETAHGRRGRPESARIPCVGRDLSTKVRKEVTTQLVTTAVTTVAPPNERAAVEAAAAQVVSLVREHRADIRRLLETAGTLWQQSRR